VQEYVVGQLFEERMYWFRLVEGRYAPVQPGPGIIESSVFHGLRLPVRRLVTGALGSVIAALAA
jgi:hypothetical protein